LATAQLRVNDLFGRIGGEEFASLLPNTTRQDALWLAERVRAAVESASHRVGEHAIRATVSVGVALSNDSTTNVDELLKAADPSALSSQSIRPQSWRAVNAFCRPLADQRSRRPVLDDYTWMTY
jgi:diguanylate cyclase (GGDEF)-like protein